MTITAKTVEPSYDSCPSQNVTLTSRERQIVLLIAQGHSNREIAAELFLSINSVKTYIRSAYRRIGVERRTQAVVWALTHVLDSVDAEEHDIAAGA